MLSRSYIKSHAKDGFLKRLMTDKRAEREAEAVADRYAIARATGRSHKNVDFKNGFKKVAFGGTLLGERGGARGLAKPARVNPVTAVDTIGASTKLPFSNSLGKFGRRPRSALMAISKVK